MHKMQGNMIKQQFEEIIKDTKILCELEPFVKKWSFKEISPHFEITSAINAENKQTLTEILRDVKPLTLCDGDIDVKRENILRELKGIMVGFTSNDDNGRNNSILSEEPIVNTLLEDQYDHELEKTLKVLQEIENVDAVTQSDIDDFIRGLGGKPDGVDVKRINIREWKDIFLEHWLDLYNHSIKSTVNTRKNLVKHQGILPNIIRPKSPIKKDRREDVVRSPKSADRFSVCNSSRVNLDGHFMTREERKNMATSFKLHGAAHGERAAKNGLHSTSSPYLFSEYERGIVENEKSLLTLRKEHHESLVPHMQEKIASSAFIGVSQPQYKNISINDLKASTDSFYGDRERQTKKIEQNNCVHETKFKAELTKNGRKDRNTGQMPSLKGKKVLASVRPSSAIPVYNPIPLTGGVSKFSVVKGKIR